MNFGLLPKYIARLGSWAGRWARLLGVQALGRCWALACWASGCRRAQADGRWALDAECAGAGRGAQGARGAQASGMVWAREALAGGGARGCHYIVIPLNCDAPDPAPEVGVERGCHPSSL